MFPPPLRDVLRCCLLFSIVLVLNTWPFSSPIKHKHNSLSSSLFFSVSSRWVLPKKGWVTVGVLLWKSIVIQTFSPPPSLSLGSLISYSLLLLFHLLCFFGSGASFFCVKQCMRIQSWDLIGLCKWRSCKQTHKLWKENIYTNMHSDNCSQFRYGA